MMLAFTRPFEIFLKTDDYFNLTTDSYKMYVPYTKFDLKNNAQDPKTIYGTIIKFKNFMLCKRRSRERFIKSCGYQVKFFFFIDFPFQFLYQ